MSGGELIESLRTSAGSASPSVTPNREHRLGRLILVIRPGTEAGGTVDISCQIKLD